MRGLTAVITGGATGMGRSIGLEFARRGVNVAFNYIELPHRDVSAQALLTETALRACGVEVYSAYCDVRDRHAVERFIGATQAELGGPHYLVNNAGIHRDAALWRMPADAWNDVVQTNLTGSFNAIRAAAPIFREQRYGKIVNVASHQASNPGFGLVNYAASKAGVVGLTKAIARETIRDGITVNAIAPAMAETELLQEMDADYIEDIKRRMPAGRLVKLEEIADMVAFVAGPRCGYTSGQIFDVTGGRATW